MKHTEKDRDKPVRHLALPGGLSVGIVNLDRILREVAELGLSDETELGRELLTRVKNDNYLAPDAVNVYSAALVKEYRKQFSPQGEKQGIDPKRTHAG